MTLSKTLRKLLGIKSPSEEWHVVEQHLRVVSGNSLCMIGGHDYNKEGVCRRKTPNLTNKNGAPGLCGARRK